MWRLVSIGMRCSKVFSDEPAVVLSVNTEDGSLQQDIELPGI